MNTAENQEDLMLEEKRTFELSTQAMHGRLQPTKSPARAANPAQTDRAAFSSAQQDNNVAPFGGFAISRDMILRIIDWLKDE